MINSPVEIAIIFGVGLLIYGPKSPPPASPASPAAPADSMVETLIRRWKQRRKRACTGVTKSR